MAKYQTSFAKLLLLVSGFVFGVTLASLAFWVVGGMPLSAQLAVIEKNLHNFVPKDDFMFTAPKDMIDEQRQYDSQQRFEEWRKTPEGIEEGKASF